MEMEDDHHHQEPQYGINDLRQLVNGPRSTHFPSIPPPPPPPSTAELFPAGHPNLMSMMFGHQVAEIMPRCLHDFTSTDSAAATATTPTTTTTTTSASTPPLSGLEAETAGCIGGDASTGRWPRQETLTLLDIRSRLDPKFKEANQKGPLWDEVSRIMSEEHGHQRSGKKCREKFENLYKYYKKTKEGKAGRQDGKHYRFFRQLEALYGENSNQTSLQETNFGTSSTLQYFQTSSIAPSQTNQELMYQSHHKHCDSLSLTNSTDFDTSSSDGNNHSTDHQGLKENDSMERRRKRVVGGRRSWKVKIKEFIDSQMRKLVEKQEEWLDKLMKTMEQKEKERVLREEEWRKQEVERLEREHKFWARERAWIEARDAALMDALLKLTKSEIKGDQLSLDQGVMEARSQCPKNEDGSEILNSTIIKGAESWLESEITRLLQLRAEMETRFRQSGCNSEEVMWEEIADKMACFGYERNALMFKEKWESIISCYPSNNNANEANKKRKESSKSCLYIDNNIDNHSSLYRTQGSACCDINDQRQDSGRRLQTNDGSSPSNSNVGNLVSADSCFQFLLSEGGNLWENYSLKINKAHQNHNQ